MIYRRATSGSREKLAQGSSDVATTRGRFAPRWSWALVCALTLGVAFAGDRRAAAQDAWEFTPYKIQIWLAFEDAPELPPALRKELERRLYEQSEAAFGATWDVTISAPPKPFASEALYRLDRFPTDDLVTAAKLGKSAQPPGKTPPGKAATDKAASEKAAAEKAAPEKPAAEKPTGTPMPPAAAPTGEAPPGAAPAAAGTGCETPQEVAQDSATAAAAAEPTAPTSASPTGTVPASDVPVPAAAPPTSSATDAEAGKPAHDPLVEELRTLFKSDKLLVASVRSTTDGWRVVTRELDIRSRRWSEMVEADVYDRDLLASSIMSSLTSVFYPVARIDYQKEKSIMLRLRAAGLSTRPEDPILVADNSFLRPWVRNNDRFGEPRPPLGVQTVPYSFLMVQKRDVARLECELHTGVRFPVTGRNTARTERFALAVRPAKASTLVRLRTNEKPPQPLSGYDIFAKDPRNENIQLIGRTDWRGTMEVPPVDDFPLRVVYVRNGGSLLARLPTIPGLEPEMTVDLTPDDRRLQAEGFISGVQAVLTDLVAQRELYAKRIRAKLTDNKIAEAEQLFEEYKLLQTRDDVQKLLDQQQPRITSPHKKVQAKIDKLFEDTRKLLYKHVDPGLLGQLENDIKQTKEGKGPYAAASGAVNAALGPSSPPPSAPPPTAPAAPAAPMGSPMGSPAPMGSPPGSPPGPPMGSPMGPPMGSPPGPPMGSPPAPM